MKTQYPVNYSQHDLEVLAALPSDWRETMTHEKFSELFRARHNAQQALWSVQYPDSLLVDQPAPVQTKSITQLKDEFIAADDAFLPAALWARKFGDFGN